MHRGALDSCVVNRRFLLYGSLAAVVLTFAVVSSASATTELSADGVDALRETAPSAPGTEPAATPGTSTDEPASSEPARGEDIPTDQEVSKTQASGDDAAEVEAAGEDRDCSDFSTQEEAQEYFEGQGGDETNNVDNLDADSDGVACESLPSGSAPSGGIDTGGGGTADKVVEHADGPAAFVGLGAALGLLLGLAAVALRRPPAD